MPLITLYINSLSKSDCLSTQNMVRVMEAILPQTGRSVRTSVLPHVAGTRTHITLT